MLWEGSGWIKDEWVLLCMRRQEALISRYTHHLATASGRITPLSTGGVLCAVRRYLGYHCGAGPILDAAIHANGRWHGQLSDPSVGSLAMLACGYTGCLCWCAAGMSSFGRVSEGRFMLSGTVRSKSESIERLTSLSCCPPCCGGRDNMRPTYA